MKKITVLVLTALLLMTMLSVPVSANGISIYFEDKLVKTEVAPVIQNGRTYVPIALIADMLGAKTEWHDGKWRMVRITQGKNVLELYIDSTYMMFNGSRIKTDVAPFIRQDRTMVPLRIISEYLGFDVTYNDLLKRVSIDKRRPVFYRITSSGAVEIYSKYSPTQDIMVKIEPCGTNNLPDFSAVYLNYNESMQIETELRDAVRIYGRSTDWHSPFIVNAKENAFSEDNYSFTGGNHGYLGNEDGAQTAHLLLQWIEADGMAVDKGYGYCNNITIRWKNAVQASNTKEPAGWGRAVMEENHELSFDGEEFTSEVTLVPLEDIEILRVYGFSAEIRNVWDDTVEYEYPDHKEKTSGKESSEATEKECIGVTCRKGKNALRITLDTEYGLGTREYFTKEDSSVFVKDYGKVYFDLVDGETVEAKEGESVSYRGTYKFYYEG